MKKVMGILLTIALGLNLTGAAFAASEITVVSREAGSGTRGAFIELTGVEVKDADGKKVDKTYEDAVIQNGTAQVITTVEGDENAIGYISLGSLGDTVKAVTVAGVQATAENVTNKTYALSRPFNIAVKDGLSDTAKDFIAWILSEEGQKIVADNHYVALTPAAYTAAPVAGKIVVGGSSSVGPLMEKLAEAYKAINTDVEIEVQISDSTTGMQGAADGTFDIGMASRELKDSEKEAGLTPTVIALDGIAVIVNKANAIDNLEIETIRQIFTGEVTDWSAVK
ncbi:MAG TPA: substrate-binding domain-containing protein [Candidatus Limiplasma sp.]|nr:substrate-binding domain-containing protein [Candidatus Limiplasma sp.]HPS80960.1 substrate-binding domain-containing protein [Candidatus Limiplasma sp.]